MRNISRKLFCLLFIPTILLRGGDGLANKKISQHDSQTIVKGSVAPGFEPVREEFRKNFVERGEIGGAVCVYHKGEKVVDLWGGVADEATQAPWREDTIVRVFSTTKGMALLVLAKLHSDSLLDYNEKVSTYWPEFAVNGKENITVEQLITHKSGLVLLERSIKVSELHDFDTLSVLLENANPMWEPGSKHGYHSATIGLYIQQLVQRIDPQGRTIGQYFAEEIARPQEVEFYIGLPEDFENDRLATLKMFSPPMSLLNLGKLPKGLWKKILNPFSLFWKSMLFIEADIRDPVLELKYEEASGGGAGDARGLAKIYGLLAIGGDSLDISPQTIMIMEQCTDAPTAGIKDEVMGWNSLGSSGGYTKPYELFDFAGSSAFGFSGTGGSFAYADPEYEVGYAYVMNKMGYYNINDPREIALREAMYRCIKDINNK